MGIYGEGKLLSAGDDLFFGLQHTVRVKLQFQSGTPFLKVWIRPCYAHSHMQYKVLLSQMLSNFSFSIVQLLCGQWFC